MSSLAAEELAYYETDDDYFGENEGFENYDAKTIDPGPWAMIVTLAVCFVTMVSVPIMVVLGERYEHRRRRLQALEQQQLEEEEAEIETKQHQPPSAAVIPPKRSAYKVNVTVDHGNDVVETERRSGRYLDPYHHKKPLPDSSDDYSKSELGGGGGGSIISQHTRTTALSNKHSAKAMTRTVIDRLLIPQYPDDDMEVKSKISFVHNRDNVITSPQSAKLSNAVKSMSNFSGLDFGGSSLMGGARSMSMLDAGAVAGRRHRRGMAKKPGAYQYLIKKYTQDEDELELELCDTATATNAVSTQPTPLQRHLAKNNHGKSVRGGASFSSKQRQDNNDGNESATNHSVTTWERHAASNVVDDISPNDAADAHDPGKDYLEKYVNSGNSTTNNLDICCGPNAMWKWSTFAKALNALVDIAEYDNEMKRIFRLAVPFVTEEVMGTVFDTIDVALVGNFIGTDAAAAYVVSDLFISMTHEFIAGIGDAQGTLCPHALGAGNNKLCAQYVQIGVIVFLVVSAPILAVWNFFIDDALLWFGMSPHVAEIGLAWTRVASIHYLVSGVSDSVVGLLEISDHEAWIAIVDISFGVVDTVATALTVTTWNVKLTTVAWIHLGSEILFFIFVMVAATRKGWYRAFYPGLIGSCALTNVKAVKHLVGAAIPLSFGSFLAYSEWEVMTFLASRLGPAEAVAWSFLGSLWETFEATTEGLGEAAAVRISLHLGRGRPDMARISSNKCLLISVLLSLFITSILFMAGDRIATLLSPDVTLQNMIAELLPLVGLGNVTMTFGMTAWHIIGAQGRYRLAMVIAMICSWGITVPLAAIAVNVLVLDLKALVSTVVIGYSITGAVMACVLLRSDWERISQIIQDINRLTGETYSDDSENEEEQSEASKSFAPKSDSSSSDSSDDDDDTQPSKKKGKKRISPKSAVSSAVSDATSKKRRSRGVSSKSEVSRGASSTTSNSLLAASALKRPYNNPKGHII